jgi:hypothetical protein
VKPPGRNDKKENEEIAFYAFTLPTLAQPRSGIRDSLSQTALTQLSTPGVKKHEYISPRMFLARNYFSFLVY